MAENTYTISALEAANDDALWQQVARGEVEVRDGDGDTVLKSLKKKTERGNTVYEPFTIAMDTDGEREECPVLYHSDELLTVTRLQPPADTPSGEPPAEAANRTVYPPTSHTALELAYYAYCARAVEKVGQPILNYEDWIEMAELVVQARWLEVAEREAAEAPGISVGEALNNLRWEDFQATQRSAHDDTERDSYGAPLDPRMALIEIAFVEAARADVVGDYLDALEKERATLQTDNAQLAARAERAEAALERLLEQTRHLLRSHAELFNSLWSHGFATPIVDEETTLDLRAEVIGVIEETEATLADDGDAQTADGG